MSEVSLNFMLPGFRTLLTINNHKSDEKELEKAAIESASNILPYDTKFADREFSLLRDFIRI